MIPLLSLVTSVKDYLEVVHKLIEYDSVNINYTEFGTIITYFIISLKTFFTDLVSFSWVNSIWSLPIIIPDISSAMVSEISVLDGYFHNAFNFLETPVSYGDKNTLIYCFEKLTIGIINSLFLFLPTSTAHIITLRRFIMQGLEAGYISGLGTIAGNLLWLTSVIFGWRFFVIPWLSLDILRYLLGFILLVKYMWDSYNEQKMVLEDISKRKIFLLNFLLALIEQTSIYPFISNLSISPEASLLESFPVDNYSQFVFVHFSYLLGVTLGCLSLLHLSCWFWENPAFKLYMWIISSNQLKVSTSFYYKVLNFTFLYLTMLSAISSIPYFGLDYTITNPLGYVNEDRIIQDKMVLETSFLGGKASDRNTRRNRGRHGRRERWKRRIRKYRTFDASLYDQGIYDLFTIEDLNYGFDRFWLRRKLRNHRVRFRFFPGPWMRNFKKQLAKPRLESYTGPRIEFFRILFEQVYHPAFHSYEKKESKLNKPSLQLSVASQEGGKNQKNLLKKDLTLTQQQLTYPNIFNQQNNFSIYSLSSPYQTGLQPSSRVQGTLSAGLSKNEIVPVQISNPEESWKGQVSVYKVQKNLINENSTLRKFVRKLDNRLKTSLLTSDFNNTLTTNSYGEVLGNSDWRNSLILNENKQNSSKIYSKQWKHLFSKIYHYQSASDKSKTEYGFVTDQMKNSVHRMYTTQAFNTLQLKPLERKQLDLLDEQQNSKTPDRFGEVPAVGKREGSLIDNFDSDSVKKEKVRKLISKKDSQILRYRSLLMSPTSTNYSLSGSKNQGTQLQTFGLEKEWTTSSQSGVLGQNQNVLFLLHPLKYYLQKETAFKRKLRYYSPSIFRKFSVENNAPYFRVMMKRYFYHFKPSLRWERTMRVASLRRSRRKNSRIPRKLQLSSSSYLSSNSNTSNSSNSSTSAILPKGEMASVFEWKEGSKRLQKPTYNYSVVSKRASRYRYQIYKDVLQHWYYSPFNRLLLKFDVDSFIRRQPNTHFLTAKEENLLHLRRFLLSEHYNTLRWYTNMEHYRSMKTRLGSGSKSFSSRVYNQQFAGTFKKIRHLFAITPAQGNVVLKFDQPLYNEISNSSKNPLLNQLIIHEELLSLDNNKPSNDLLSQSQNIVREYLMQARTERANYIKNLLNENNYTKLAQFIYKGQKLRGTEAVTNQRLLNNQEKDYLLTEKEKNEINQQLRSFKLRQFMIDQNLMEDFYMTFLKKWKRRMNDQESLKHFITRRVEKREKRKQKKEKNVLLKLKRLENWVGTNQNNLKSSSTPSSTSTSTLQLENESLTTGLQKAILEGMYTLNDKNVTSALLPQSSDGKNVKTGTSQNVKSSPNDKSLWKVLLLSKIKQKTSTPVIKYKDLNLSFNDLKQNKKQQLFKQIKTSTLELRNILNNLKTSETLLSSTQNLNQKQDGKTQKNLYAFSNKTRLKRFIPNLQNRVLNLYNLFTTKTSSYLGLNYVKSFLKPIKRQTLKNWRKKERALGKQKRLRKEFKMLTKPSSLPSSYSDSNAFVQDIEMSLQNTIPNRKKREGSSIFTSSFSYFPTFEGIKNLTQEFNLDQTFKRKRSPQRRSRVRRNRGVFKKRTIVDILKKEVKLFYKLTKDKDKDLSLKFGDNRVEEMKKSFYTKMNSNLYAVDKEDESTSLKQRKSKQRKQRFWKQKRQKYSQKRRKYRKRRRYVMGKIRVLNKQLKRIKNKIEIQNWWWKQFIPSIQASTEALWQIEKDQLIQQKLSELSSSEMLERERLFQLQQSESQFNTKTLQIGNKDFKPLAVPEAIRLKEEFFKNKTLTPNPPSLQPDRPKQEIPTEGSFAGVETSTNKTSTLSLNTNSVASGQVSSNLSSNSNFGIINKLYENLLIPTPAEGWDKTVNSYKENFMGKDFKDFMFPNVSLPFYAGWDESLRKFVVTNRMLSRKEAGFEVKQLDSTTAIPALKSLNLQKQKGNDGSLQNIEFSQAPLRGMNAATTLYWQIPFTTYDPDQFFALGMDGFSPIGWRKFLFRHSILKTWLDTLASTGATKSELASTQKQQQVSNSLDSEKGNTGLGNAVLASGYALNGTESAGLIVKSKTSLIDNLKQTTSLPLFKRSERTFDAKNVSRRLKKRYRRVKKHPRTPVWFPSGPLLNQVLPVHYIYVFYKRARLPRDRYLKRKLLNTKSITKSEGLNTIKMSNPEYFSMDFTLRKRLKPKRKYHLKRDYYSSNIVIPRRLKFMGSSEGKGVNEQSMIRLTNSSSNPSEVITQQRWRPLSSLKINKPIQELVKEQKYLRLKQRGKEELTKGQAPNIRVKQLRRRVQRQVLRSIWRYRPRAGGFVWPGDYLKLEPVKAPQLDSLTSTSTSTSTSQASANAAVQPSVGPKGAALIKENSLLDLDLDLDLNLNLEKEEGPSMLIRNQNIGKGVSGQRSERAVPPEGKGKKKKRPLVEWQIQPKKYLYEKHNKKVLKKKLEKTFRSYK
jgi:hypothetical protein